MKSDVSADEQVSAGGGGAAYGYQTMSVKALRGREGAIRSKWEAQGWEFVSSTPGALRSELAFRKPKPKGLGAYATQGYHAFKRLEPTTQRRIVIGTASLVGALILGAVLAAVLGGDPEPDGQPAPAAPQATDPAPEAAPGGEEPPADTKEPEPAYVYSGPDYEVIISDPLPAAEELTQHWILVDSDFDFEGAGFKKQIKAILVDMAQREGTTAFLANVVTNREIAEAEAFSTQSAFVAEHSDEYFVKTIPAIEVEGWLASYTGGFDYDTGEPSAEAHEVIWRPHATSEVEYWVPAASADPKG